MAYAQVAIVLVDNPCADGRRPVMVVSNADSVGHNFFKNFNPLVG
jgi:hypothetical protein